MSNQIFDERHLRLTFDDTWSVVKYDAHLDCKKLQGAVEGTKAVDFVAMSSGLSDGLFLIEVKDFRTFPTEQRQELNSGGLVAEVAQKIRDTIPGLVGAHRMSSSPATWRPFLDSLHNLQADIRVVLWFEGDYRAKVRAPNSMTTLMQELKTKLRWLTTKVMVLNLEHGASLPGLTVTSLAREEQSPAD